MTKAKEMLNAQCSMPNARDLRSYSDEEVRSGKAFEEIGLARGDLDVDRLPPELGDLFDIMENAETGRKAVTAGVRLAKRLSRRIAAIARELANKADPYESISQAELDTCLRKIEWLIGHADIKPTKVAGKIQFVFCDPNVRSSSPRLPATGYRLPLGGEHGCRTDQIV